MSETSLPPCGPERDRLVAQAVGWAYPEQHRKVVVSDRVWPDTGEAQWHYEGDDKPIALEWRCRFSTSDAAAIAALKAWKAKTQGSVNIILDSAPDAAFVALEDFEGDVLLYANRPTLADAATAALVRWYLDTQEGK